MRTVEFVRRLTSVSVSDAVSFVDNIMKICEACTAAVYSLRTDNLPSTHSPILDDDADAVESTATAAPPSIINAVVAAVSSSSLVTNKCADSCPTSYPLGSNNYQAERWIATFATIDTQALNLIISSLASFIHPAS